MLLLLRRLRTLLLVRWYLTNRCPCCHCRRRCSRRCSRKNQVEVSAGIATGSFSFRFHHKHTKFDTLSCRDDELERSASRFFLDELGDEGRLDRQLSFASTPALQASAARSGGIVSSRGPGRGETRRPGWRQRFEDYWFGGEGRTRLAI